MSITNDGWLDWAIRDPGPLNKTNGGRNTIIGCVPHSAEGYWPHLQTLLHSQTRRASWAFSNLQDGRLFQHYPIYAQTWTSGSAFPNNNFVAWENEGVAGEPLTVAQTSNIVRIIKEISALGRWVPRRPTSPIDKGASLYEHNECVRWGSEPTACPSGRIPWDVILAALAPEEDMAERVWCAETVTTWIVGKHGAAPVAYPVDDAIWEALYGGHTRVMTVAELEKLRVPK